MPTLQKELFEAGLFYGYGCNICTKDPLYHEKQISHRGENPGACADWLYCPESQRTIFLALNRADVVMPPEEAPVNGVEKLDSILRGIHGILEGKKHIPACNLLLEN